MSQIRYVQNDHDIEKCWQVVYALRPHLQKENYVQQVKEMEQEGYRMLYIAETVNGEEIAVAFAGYRNMQMLYCGKIIYIDDLSTLPEFRGKGYAGALLDYIHQLAKETGKDAVHLDSGYQRNDAHRLYLNKGYKLASHHFSRGC
ncbi:MAG: GNAT family N-acetyltransferase [Chitinophagaceae bacterium]